MNSAFPPLTPTLRPKATKATEVPDYLSLFDEPPPPLVASVAFGRSDLGKQETRTNKGPGGASVASVAFVAGIQTKVAVQAALFEPSGPGFIVLESRDFGRMVWTARDSTVVPARFEDLPRYSWPELERILDSGITRESLHDLHRAKKILPGTVVSVRAEPVCLDCSIAIPQEALLCEACFEARKVVPIEEMARRREARRTRPEAS